MTRPLTSQITSRRAGRPLIPSERELLQSFVSEVELDRVRIYGTRTRIGRFLGVWGGGRAVALGYRIVLPGRVRTPVLAHELAHVTQFVRWGWLRYFAAGIWNQLILRGLFRRDVYRWEYVPDKDFSAYGMEQQGQIVQDCFDQTSAMHSPAQLVSPFQPNK